jgi:hypothetical protein
MIAGNLDLLSHERRKEVAHAVVEFHNYFGPLIDERREGGDKDDALSALVTATVEGESSLTTAELLPIISQVLLAGHETTTNLITNGMVALSRGKGAISPSALGSFTGPQLHRGDAPVGSAGPLHVPSSHQRHRDRWSPDREGTNGDPDLGLGRARPRSLRQRR